MSGKIINLEKLKLFSNISIFNRFWSKVSLNKETGCWEWIAGLTVTGYGKFAVGSRTDNSRKTVLSHRVAYVELISEIPDELQIDHLCRNRKCVNPLHLEPVTAKVNFDRGLGMLNHPLGHAANKAKTHCPQLHQYTESNTYYYTTKKGIVLCMCKECARIRCRVDNKRRSILNKAKTAEKRAKRRAERGV